MLQADGGTRCAAITGGYVALRLALQKLVDAKAIETMPLTGSVAAISVGMVDRRALCDLDYSEDSTRRGRRQRGDDRRRRPGRGAGDGRAHAALARLARRAARPRRGRDRAPAPGAGAGSRALDLRHRQQAQAARDARAAAGGRAGAAAGGGRAAARGRRLVRRDRAREGAGGASRPPARPAIADDSGIGASALGGRPGIHSARYGGEGASDEENLEKLLREVAAAGEDRRAFYTCALALVEEDGAEHVFEGRCEGVLIEEPRGEGGFGYDPAFVPDDTGPDDERTMSELSRGREERDQPPRPRRADARRAPAAAAAAAQSGR